MNVLLALRANAALLPQRLLRTPAVLMALTCLMVGHATPALAIFSCEAGAGPTVSGGSADSCGLNKYSASADSNVDGGGVGYLGSASVSLAGGAQAGAITLADNTPDGVGPPASNGSFYANLLVDFRISGPSSGIPVPVTVLSGVSGTISAECVNCEASISYLLRLQHPDMQIEVTGGRTRSSEWLTNRTTFGASGDVSASADGFGGAFTFDAAGLLNENIRLRSELSGTVALTGPNPSGASVSANATHTALFNVILPAGYSIVADPSAVPLLTAPVLQVPEPESVALLTVGLIALVAVVRRRANRR